MKQSLNRTCMGCNKKNNKYALIRIVKDYKDNAIKIDETGKIQGRGAYICNNISCLEKAIKNKRIEKTLKKRIENEFYNKLRGVIIDKQ